MSVNVTLHYYLHPDNSKGHKILAAAAMAKGVKCDSKMIALPITDDFKRNCSPLGGNPVLETAEGYVFESNAILRHIARLDQGNTLYGKTAFESSSVDAWLDLATSEFEPLIAHIYAVAFGKKTSLPDDWVESTDSVFQGIETWLETRTFLVGERITIADICIAYTLQFFYRKSGHGEHFVAKFKNVWRLYNAVMNQPASVEVLTATGASFGLPAPTAAAEAQ